MSSKADMDARRRLLLFGAFTAVLLAANVRLGRDFVQLAIADATASHVVLIPFVTVFLIHMRRADIFRDVAPAPLGAAAVIATGAALIWYGYGQPLNLGTAMRVKAAGMVLLWGGAFVATFGRRAARAAAFPLLFLVFTIPPPTAVVDAVTLFLKRGSAEMVAGLFSLTRTPYFREGYVFTLPTCAIEIADECSGIRSSIALLLTTLLAGHLFLNRTTHRLLVVAAVLPIAIVKNGVRIVSLALLGTHVDPQFLTGQLHQDGGVVFFLLGLGLLMPLFVFFHNAELLLLPKEAYDR